MEEYKSTTIQGAPAQKALSAVRDAALCQSAPLRPASVPSALRTNAPTLTHKTPTQPPTLVPPPCAPNPRARTEKIGLDRDRMVQLALLLGSDYTEGVKGVGVVNALEICTAFPGVEGLRRFKARASGP